MSQRRWIQLLGALILAGAIAWIARHTYWDYVTVDKPLQGEALTNPFYTFEHLLRRLGHDTRRVPDLQTLPSPAGVLVVSDLHGEQIKDRVNALERWVEQGGRLLVSRDVLLSSPPLQSWSGIGLALRDADKKPGAPQTARFVAPGADCPPLIERVEGTISGQQYHACIRTGEFSLASRRTPAWSLSNEYGLQMLRVAIVKGSLAVIECDCVMGNKSLLHQDHARLVYAAVPLNRDGEVAILDPKDAESLLVMLWRGGSAAILCGLAALMLAIWRNLPRFGAIAPVPAPLRRSLAEQIRARARFAWRTRKLASLRRVQRRALESAGRRHLPSYDRLDAAQRISALSSRSGVASAALRAALADEFRGGPEAELAAITLLESTRRTLDRPITRPHGALT